MSMLNDPFFQVPQTQQTTSEGDVSLPILYYDASAFYAFFLVDKEKANDILREKNLEADMTIGKHSIAGFACYEYRDTTVGVYNEVGLALTACPIGENKSYKSWWDFLTTLTTPEVRHTGMHVVHLPVTTKAANAAGREIWGFPKFVTGIDYFESGRDFACVVRDPDKPNPDDHIASLKGKMGLGLPVKPLSLTLFTSLKNHLLRSTVNARGASKLHSAGDLKLTVGPSKHPMADTLRKLDMDGAKPLAVVHTDCFQSRLNAGFCLA